jgi:hypothetical protein
MTSRRLAAVFFGLVFLLLAAPASAQLTAGVRAGASIDPDQFYFGGHVETEPLVENVYFRPNVEIGVGDNVTTLAFNFELAYKFPTTQQWRPYAIAGPALVIYDVGSDTSSHGGFNLGVGFEHSGGLFAEVKAGLIDSPNFKVGIGFRF